MKRIQKPQQFYDDAERSVKQLMKKHSYVYIGQNLKVPNELRTNDAKMKLWSQITSRPKFRINQIVPWNNHGSFQLHVLRSVLLMIHPDGKQVLLPKTSWLINESSSSRNIHVKGTFTHILIEYREPLNDVQRPMEDDSSLESQTVVFTPTVEDFKQKRSFIRAPLPNDEIRRLIRFIDCECTQSMRKEKKTPLSVAILNYEGKVILNTLVTPRNYIEDYGTRFHGITEKKSRNQEDEYEIIMKIQKAMKGKILVGHDLALELSCLLIPKYKLMGIRDLAGAKVFRSRKLIPKNNGQWYKLQTLAAEICGLEIQKEKHSALEDVEAIRKIYLTVEDDWEDDINPISQTVNCTKTSLEEYEEKQNQPQSTNEEEPASKRMKIWTPTVDLDDEDLEPWDSSPDCQIMDEDNAKLNVAETSTEDDNNTIKSITIATDTADLHVIENIGTQTEEIINVNSLMMDDNDYLDVVELIFAEEGSVGTHENRSISTQTEVIINEIEQNMVMKINKDEMTTTVGWDPELDELIAEKIEIRGEEFIKTKTIVEYRSSSGKIKIKTFDH